MGQRTAWVVAPLGLREMRAQEERGATRRPAIATRDTMRLVLVSLVDLGIGQFVDLGREIGFNRPIRRLVAQRLKQ